MNSSDNHDIPKKRSVTELTLGWIAERLKKAERIKEEVKSGAYKVDSQIIAEAMVGEKK